MKQMKTYICCQTFFALVCSSMLVAADVTPDTTTPTATTTTTSKGLVIDSSLCTKDVLMTFFPQPVVKAVLIQHKIPQDKAEVIAKELSQKSQDVAKIVESKASKMDPNPFNDLSQRDTAVKIFRETLFEVFSQALKSNGIEKDNAEIQNILDDMQEAKGKLFVECIKNKTIQ